MWTQDMAFSITTASMIKSPNEIVETMFGNSGSSSDTAIVAWSDTYFFGTWLEAIAANLHLPVPMNSVTSAWNDLGEPTRDAEE